MFIAGTLLILFSLFLIYQLDKCSKVIQYVFGLIILVSYFSGIALIIFNLE